MAKNPGGRQENTKGSKGSFSAGASPVSGKQTVATGGGGIGSFFSGLFGGGGGGAPQNRMPDGSRMDTITKSMGSKSAPVYGQRTLGMAAAGTPGLSDKLALNQAAMAAASQPQGIMGIVQNLMPGMSAINAARGVMKHMRPASAFPPRFGVDGQMTPYGEQMQQNSQLLAQQMANQGGNDDPFTPPAPEVPAVDPNAMPTERPPWWPAYLPWPPAPQSAIAPTPAPMPVQNYGSLPVPNSYSTSYSGLQNAISGAQNPLNMGIGGIRTP